MAFAINVDFERRRRADHGDFYCPAGHSQAFLGKSELEKTKEEVLRAQSVINEERHLRLVVERERDKVIRSKERLEKRISAGVCPCCNRTFGDLASHMKVKHKEYALPSADKKRIEGTIQ